jgi:3-methyladenine DNA glycosylase AlkD
MLNQLKKDIQKLGSPKRAVLSERYFKTGKGEYGEGDIFLGLTVPETRATAKKYADLPLTDIETLLHDPIHEYRLSALMILMEQFRLSDEAGKKKIYAYYLANTKYINNWDLIDLSARDIIGGYLADKKDRRILYSLARSTSIWERRMSIIATFAFLKVGEFSDAFAIAEILLHDTHDLIHKAVGWVLREVGKKDLDAEEVFLQKYHRTMPRTMLRYSIERMSQEKKTFFMKR